MLGRRGSVGERGRQRTLPRDENLPWFVVVHTRTHTHSRKRHSWHLAAHQLDDTTEWSRLEISKGNQLIGSLVTVEALRWQKCFLYSTLQVCGFTPSCLHPTTSSLRCPEQGAVYPILRPVSPLHVCPVLSTRCVQLTPGPSDAMDRQLESQLLNYFKQCKSYETKGQCVEK